MRHPFDGIEVPAVKSPHRRSLLKGFLAAVAGLFAWKVAQAKGFAPPVFVPPPPPFGGPMTAALNEAGRPGFVNPNDPEPPDFRLSTAVRGEEGASVGGPGGPLTGAAFENGGPTTRALREEGMIGPGGPPMVTTLALGEEGAVAPGLPGGAVPIRPRIERIDPLPKK